MVCVLIVTFINVFQFQSSRMEDSMAQTHHRIRRFTSAAILALLLSFFTMGSPNNSQSVAEVTNIQSLRYHLVPANSARGKQLFVNKGCVICHSVNNAGGDVGPPLDIDPSNETIDVFGFAARMWKGAEEMVALQVMEVGFPIELNGQELAHLAHFLHDHDAQMTFSDEDIPAIVRKLMEAEKRKEPNL
jgi:mono/diheme cytochrome c family protein